MQFIEKPTADGSDITLEDDDNELENVVQAKLTRAKIRHVFSRLAAASPRMSRGLDAVRSIVLPGSNASGLDEASDEDSDTEL